MTKPKKAKTEYRLVFGHNITPDTASVLKDQICKTLSHKDFGNLVVMFSSIGGNTNQSIALFNFIRSLTFPIHMHAMGHVGSAAIPVFLAADKRTAEPLARFHFHEYHWNFDGAQTLNSIEEASNLLRNDIQAAQKIICDRTRLTDGDDIIKAVDGTKPSATIEAKEAVPHGIIDDIFCLGECDTDNTEVRMCVA